MSVIEFSLAGTEGFGLRQKAANYMDKYSTNTGAERGSATEQGSGLLAEITVRHLLHLPNIEDDSDRHTNLGYDILSPTGVKIDVKCRGGKRPFEETYAGSGSIRREAKHNFFARQIFDERLDTDIYLMTHLMYASDGALPGTNRQKNWRLFICGWVSKARVKRDGVFLPRGSITEQGNTWFAYRGQEIEFYHRNLNPLQNVTDILALTISDVRNDENYIGYYNLTSVDAVRIAMDLFARGLINEAQLGYIKREAQIIEEIEPILNPNQYLHLAKWLYEKGQMQLKQLEIIESKFPLIEFTGI